MHKTVYLAHHGIKGQKWGIRRFQNKDGTLTAEGRKRHSKPISDLFFGKKRKEKREAKRKEKAKKKQNQELLDYDVNTNNAKKKKDSPEMTPQQKAEYQKKLKEAQDYVEKAYDEIYKRFVDEDGSEYYEIDEDAFNKHIDKILELDEEFDELVI